MKDLCKQWADTLVPLWLLSLLWMTMSHLHFSPYSVHMKRGDQLMTWSCPKEWWCSHFPSTYVYPFRLLMLRICLADRIPTSPPASFITRTHDICLKSQHRRFLARCPESLSCERLPTWAPGPCVLRQIGYRVLMSMPSMRRVFSKLNFQVSSRSNSRKHLARVCFLWLNFGTCPLNYHVSCMKIGPH